MSLIKCNECKNEISDKANICPKCGCPIETKLFCEECGQEISLNDDMCKNCGCPISMAEDNTSNNENKPTNKKQFNIKNKLNIQNIFNILKKNKKVSIIVGIVLVVFIIMIAPNFKNIVKPSLDVKATTYQEYLRLELIYGKDIDFDDITSGGTCLSGRQTLTVESKKYGTVTVEYYYCKLKDEIYLHMYN